MRRSWRSVTASASASVWRAQDQCVERTGSARGVHRFSARLRWSSACHARFQRAAALMQHMACTVPAQGCADSVHAMHRSRARHAQVQSIPCTDRSTPLTGPEHAMHWSRASHARTGACHSQEQSTPYTRAEHAMHRNSASHALDIRRRVKPSCAFPHEYVRALQHFM